VSHASFGARRRREELLWSFEVRGAKDEDGNSARLSLGPVVHNVANLDDLLSTTIQVPEAYDEDRDQPVATLHYLEHHDLNDNVLAFLRRQGDAFAARWTATCPGLDEDDEEATVTVEASLDFEGFTPTPAKGLRVLLLTPHRAQRSSVRNYLTDCGFEVTARASIDEGVSSLAEGAFDLVVCQFMPPPEAAAFVRRHRQSGASARLLLVSGPLAEAERRVYAELGVDRILESQALDLAVLEAAVEEFESRLSGTTEG
jgi:CheY-like chemotaxis protein